MQNSAVEIQFQLHATGRQPGRTGPPSASATGNGRLPRVTQVVALALHFQDIIQRGEARDYADLARLGCLTRERMSQIMELVWLAPDITEEVLCLPTTPSGRYPISESNLRRMASFMCWAEQRRLWGEVKDRHFLAPVCVDRKE